MNNTKKVLALLLALAMIFGLAACTSGGGSQGGGTDEPETNETPLVVGYSPFSSKFSPFFSETAYDQDVYAMTQANLLTSDRTGAIIYKGIEGETIPYNGTDYTYYGPADLEVKEHADGTVDYNVTLRDDLVFSDGTPMTIDDVIFSMYV
ncbi:MAG: ABC transporter substrate-binding protein, partial [Firmicutes bacterium]|nr:ABC transporter substrate-binding protein [Bacillota bacterium]